MSESETLEKTGAGKQVEVRFSETSADGRPTVTVVVPRGTKLVDTLKLQEFIAANVLPKLFPGTCDNCISGNPHFLIEERIREVVRIDIERLEIISGDFKQG